MTDCQAPELRRHKSPGAAYRILDIQSHISPARRVIAVSLQITRARNSCGAQRDCVIVRPRIATRLLIQVTVLALAACSSAPRTTSTTTTTGSTTLAPLSIGPKPSLPALFYAKAGALYVSDPAGSPGRKLTNGPADTQPAPSPDGAHLAYTHKANASDEGSEVWVLDLSPQGEVIGSPRRLVGKEQLPAPVEMLPRKFMSPRWSPTGEQVALLELEEGGGLLFVADARTGAVPRSQPLMFAKSYAWAPDGRHIAWVGGRSDVRPVAVNVFTVGGGSTPVVSDTNAFAVTYGHDGQSVLFANGDASGMSSAETPFAISKGGIYSVATPDGAPADTPATPEPLVTGQAYYGDVAALPSGALAFTTADATSASKKLLLLKDPSAQSKTLGDVATDPPGPAWGPGDVVAFLDASPGRPLVVLGPQDRSPKQVDTGVDSFAWPP